MSDLADNRVFDETDVLIIAGRALGMSQEAVGNWLRTPLHPVGVSERTVRNRTEANRDAYSRLIMHIATAFQVRQQEFEQISKEKYRELLARLRAKGIKVRELALDQGIANPTDTESLQLANKVAESLENRDLGMPKHVHQIGGEVGIRHFFDPRPVRQLASEEVDMINSDRLLASLPEGVLEAELVE